MVRPAHPRLRIALLAVLGILLTVATGCARPGSGVVGVDPGSADGEHGTALGSPAMAGLGVDCDSVPDRFDQGPALTPLPADAVLVAASRCLYETQQFPGDGEWMMRIEQTAESGLAALAAALRLPSQTSDGSEACDLIKYGPVIITVTDGRGRQLHPEVPETACGAPLPAAVDAITALPWTTVATTKARQTRSELEVSSGCSGGYKPVIALIAAENLGTEVAKTAIDATPRPLSVCRYALDPDPANVISLDNGPALKMGVLVSASTLDSAGAGKLLAEVAAAPRASPCSQPQSPFAVVHPTDGSAPWIYVELGGCNRALNDVNNSLRQLDASVVSLLKQ
jgi:hypothetical protein